MNTVRIIAPVLILVLSACTPITLHMNVDQELEKNSYIYPVKFNTSWSRYYMDLNFGTYHVKKSTSIITSTLDEKTANPTMMNYFIFGENEIVSSKVATAHSYEFEQDTKTLWKAECLLVSEQREKKHDGYSIIDNTSSQYVCNYTRENSAPWYLAIVVDDNDKVVITMNSKNTQYLAVPTLGEWRKKDGSKSNINFANGAGYTWMNNNNKIAAVSTQEDIPKVYLSKKNDEELNSILSMASAGVLLYELRVSEFE